MLTVVLMPVRGSSTCTAQPPQMPQSTCDALAAITFAKVRTTRRVLGSQSLKITVPGASESGCSSRSPLTARRMLYPIGSLTAGPSCRPELVTGLAVAGATITLVVPRGYVSSHTSPRPAPGLSHSVSPSRRAVATPSAMKYTGSIGPGQSGWHWGPFGDGTAAQPPRTRRKEYGNRLRGSPAIVWLTSLGLSNHTGSRAATSSRRLSDAGIGRPRIHAGSCTVCGDGFGRGLERVGDGLADLTGEVCRVADTVGPRPGPVPWPREATAITGTRTASAAPSAVAAATAATCRRCRDMTRRTTSPGACSPSTAACRAARSLCSISFISRHLSACLRGVTAPPPPPAAGTGPSRRGFHRAQAATEHFGDFG